MGMKEKLNKPCHDYEFQGMGLQSYLVLIEKRYQQNKKDEVAIISNWAARSCGTCEHGAGKAFAHVSESELPQP